MGRETYTSTVTIIDCGECTVTFGLETSMYDRVTKTGEWFWCPNGHRIHYFESENQRLRNEKEAAERRLIRERAALDQARADRDAARNSVRTLKGVVTKTKKRAAAGVCPVPGCKRSFQNVAAHVRSQHPDFVQDHAHA